MQSAPIVTHTLDQRHIVPSEQVIAKGDDRLEATLTVPPAARGVVALVHASSAGRFAPLHRFTAEVFEQAGLATLQVDLLSPAEEAELNPASREHVMRLVGRIQDVVDWLREQPETYGLRVGLFASTRELVPALIAAERRPGVVAVVARGGWPSTFDEPLTTLRAPTLFLVGAEEQARAAELALEFFARHLRSSR